MVRRAKAAGGRRRRWRGALFEWGSAVLVLAVLAGAAAAYRWDLGTRWFGAPATSGAAPPSFTLPATPTAGEVARPAPAGHPRPAAVRRALGPALRDPDLYALRAVVAPLSGHPLLDQGRGPSVPASTLKLLTTTAALQALGPGHTFTTRVVREGARLTLVGGGDPFLAGKQPHRGPERDDASLQRLASLTARHLRHQLGRQGRRTVHLSYDATLFTGPVVDPAWPSTYVPEQVVTPISALWVDQGVAPDRSHRVSDPPAAAAAELASYLRGDGVRVAGPVRSSPAPLGAHEVARVTSVPLADIVERVLQTSDNEGAEVLARQTGLAVTGTGSFAGGVAGVRRTLTHLGIDLHGARIFDGSGLSRRDRVDAETLVETLQLDSSAEHPGLRSVVSGLPVAGFDGSLTARLSRARSGRGWVRAKTGTLTGTSALAGIASDSHGHPLVFAFVSNHIPSESTLDARAALDRLAAALAACPC